MSKEKELAKNTIILTVGKICTQFISFFLIPLYTKLLAPSEFGVIDLLNSYVALLVPVFNLQFENGLFRFLLDCRGDKPQQSKIFSTVAIANGMQAAFYLFIYLLLQNFIKTPYKSYLATSVILMIFLNTLLQFPRGLGNNKAYAVGSFISAVSTVIFNVIFIAILRIGIWGMLIATILSQILTIIYLFVSQKTWKFFSVRSFDSDLLKKIIQYSWPLVPNQLGWWVLEVSDRTVLSFFICASANGIYSIANKFSSLFSTLFNIFNMSWTESVSLHIQDVDRNKFLTEIVNMMFKLFASVCFFIISTMPFVFGFFVNEKYQEAYFQIPILLIAVLFQIVVGLYSAIYIALKKSKEVAKTTSLAAIINLVVDLLLVNKIGIYAASLSTLISFGVMAIYRYFHVRKYVKIEIESKILLSNICIGGISLFFYYYNRLFTNIVSLLIILIWLVVCNYTFLISIYKTFISKVKESKTSFE